MHGGNLAAALSPVEINGGPQEVQGSMGRDLIAGLGPGLVCIICLTLHVLIVVIMRVCAGPSARQSGGRAIQMSFIFPSCFSL